VVTRIVPLRRRRASVVCLDDDQLLCVRLRDPVTGVACLFVPGGAIEVGETPAQAAQRETLEETGFRVRLGPDEPVVARYPFRWAGVHIGCTTHFFGAELVGAREAPQERSPDEPTYNEETLWVPLARVDAELAFHTQIHEAVKQVLHQLEPS